MDAHADMHAKDWSSVAQGLQERFGPTVRPDSPIEMRGKLSQLLSRELPQYARAAVHAGRARDFHASGLRHGPAAAPAAALTVEPMAPIQRDEVMPAPVAPVAVAAPAAPAAAESPAAPVAPVATASPAAAAPHLWQ